MPEEPNEGTFLHHQPLDSRPTVVRPRLSRGWEYDFYPDRIAKESEPATVVLCDRFGIRCITGSRAATTSKSAIIRLGHDTHPQVGVDGRFVAKEAASKTSCRCRRVVTGFLF